MCKHDSEQLMEQRAVVKYLVSQDLRPADVCIRIREQFGNAAMKRGTLYSWCRKFKNGRESISISKNHGRRQVVCTDENIERVRAAIHSDRRTTLDKLSMELELCRSVVHT